MVRLFDIKEGVVIPSEHTFVLSDLKFIRTKYTSCYNQAYAYLFYMTCPNPEYNPFFDTKDEDREYLIMRQLGKVCFSTEDDEIIKALELCRKLYETPTYRAYKGIKKMLDNLADYMEKTRVIDGRDGNGAFLISAAKNFQSIRESYKGTFKDLMEEQSSIARGGAYLPYDQ